MAVFLRIVFTRILGKFEESEAFEAVNRICAVEDLAELRQGLVIFLTRVWCFARLLLAALHALLMNDCTDDNTSRYTSLQKTRPKK